MVVLATREDGYVVDDDGDRLMAHADLLFENLSRKSWLVGVERGQLEARLPDSWTFGLFEPGPEGSLAGFMVRAMTGRPECDRGARACAPRRRASRARRLTPGPRPALVTHLDADSGW